MQKEPVVTEYNNILSNGLLTLPISTITSILHSAAKDMYYLRATGSQKLSDLFYRISEIPKLFLKQQFKILPMTMRKNLPKTKQYDLSIVKQLRHYYFML